MNEYTAISAGDRSFRLYVATPKSESRPGVLVLHPWWGLNEFLRGVCDRLADAGFLVVAPDLYDGTVATTIEEAEAIESTLDGTHAIEDITAALEYLREHPRRTDGLGLVGFSMGAYYGLMVIENRPMVVDAAILFYGTNEGEYEETTTAFLGHFAKNDQFESPDAVEALRDRLQAGAGSVTFHTYPDTEHWFFEADRPEYDEAAAELAWERSIEFLRAEG